MPRWERYEIWIQKGGQWEMMSAFADFEIASAVARSRSSRMRLVHATYEADKMVVQDVLMELGAPRENST